MALEWLPWGILITCDLFLGGAAGGAFMVGAVQDLRAKGKQVAKFAAFVAIVAVIFELVALFLDLGQPLRAINAFDEPLSSVMSFGTWTISAFAVIAVVYASFFFTRFPWSKSDRGRKVFAVLGAILALVLLIYTGVLLGVVFSRPLWSQALLPVLFLANGVSTGIALVQAAPKLMSVRSHSDLGEETKGFESVNLILLGVQSLIVLMLVFTLNNSTTAASQAINTWLTGYLSLDFWVGYLAIGLAAPALLYAGVLVRWKRDSTPSALASALIGVLVPCGGFMLRYIVLGGGLNIDFLQGIGITTPTVVVFGPTTTELLYTISLFSAMVIVYAVGAVVLLRSRAGSTGAVTSHDSGTLSP